MDAKAAFIPLFIAAILGTAAVIPFGVGQQALAQTGTNQTGTTGNQTQTGTTTGNQTSTNQTDTTGNQGSANGPRSNNGALRGPIASVQLDENGAPAWIQSGIWVLRTLGPPADTPGNQTAGQNMQFIARFAMVMPDGTAMHTHSIYGFQASEVTQDGNSTMINGTATVTLREGPMPDVPVTLQISSDTVLAISIDPEATDAHFGDGPVYGLLSPFSRSIVEEEVAEIEEEESPEEEDETPPEEDETPPTQTGTIELSVEEDGEDYAWSSDDGTNPTLEMVAGEEYTIEIDNPTDEEHHLIIESDGEELESSGDIAAGESGELTITPEEEGTLDYYCQYHPDTMSGTIEVSASEEDEEEPEPEDTSMVEMSVEGDDEESFRWLANDELNPTLEMVAGNETTIEIDNPSDEEHNLVIESDGEVLEESGDIAAGEDGTLTITPEEEGTLDYHCEYHPETMVGTIEVSSSS